VDGVFWFTDDKIAAYLKLEKRVIEEGKGIQKEQEDTSEYEDE
jgi:hypothetical protein